MDRTDKAILNLLQKDAKLNIKQIAHEVGLTTTPTYERIKRLEKSGIIDSYKAVLDKKKINKGLEVFCQVSLSIHAKDQIDNFAKEINLLDDVLDCYHVTGSSDYLLRVLVSDIEEYQQFITNKLSSIEHVSNVQSAFVLANLKSDSSIKL